MIIKNQDHLSDDTLQKKYKGVHESKTVEWLNKRFNKRQGVPYLTPYQELQNEQLKQIFKEYQLNKEGQVDINQLKRELQKYGLKIKKEDIQLFFRNTDLNKQSISWDDFVNCVIQNDNNNFNKFINKGDGFPEYQSKITDEITYVPRSFDKTVNYLNLNRKRSEKADQINNKKETLAYRFDSCKQLMKLNYSSQNVSMKIIKPDSYPTEQAEVKPRTARVQSLGRPILVKYKSNNKLQKQYRNYSVKNNQYLFMRNDQEPIENFKIPVPQNHKIDYKMKKLIDNMQNIVDFTEIREGKQAQLLEQLRKKVQAQYNTANERFGIQFGELKQGTNYFDQQQIEQDELLKQKLYNIRPKFHISFRGEQQTENKVNLGTQNQVTQRILSRGHGSDIPLDLLGRLGSHRNQKNQSSENNLKINDQQNNYYYQSQLSSRQQTSFTTDKILNSKRASSLINSKLNI